MPKKKRSVGRPRKTPKGGRMVTLYLPNELADKLKILGGSVWVAKQLKKSRIRKRADETKEAEAESTEEGAETKEDAKP